MQSRKKSGDAAFFFLPDCGEHIFRVRERRVRGKCAHACVLARALAGKWHLDYVRKETAPHEHGERLLCHELPFACQTCTAACGGAVSGSLENPLSKDRRKGATHPRRGSFRWI